MNSLKVSIIVPVYNVEKYIEECIESVLQQTYDNIELILIDDRGNDNSIRIAEKKLASQNKIQYKIIIHQENKGVSASRNTGIMASSGNCLFFLDSDDMLLPNCIELLVSEYYKSKPDLLVCNYISDKENSRLGGYLKYKKSSIIGKECIKALADSWFNVAPWCKLVNKDFLVKNHIFFKEGIINEDVLWTFNICLNAQKISFLNEPLYYYRMNSNSIMWNSKKELIVESNKIITEEMYNIISKNTIYLKDINIVILYIRQLINLFTLTFSYIGFKKMNKMTYLLLTLKYKSSNLNIKKLPLYYKLWLKVNYLPTPLKSIYIYSLIFIHTLKKRIDHASFFLMP